MKPIPFRQSMLAMLMFAAIALGRPHDARAFCGFYVGKANASLINHASQVVVAHRDDKTVISLMNDYQGEPSEFALVVPVLVVLQKGQVHIGDRELFTKLDAYSAPRLVEYFDPNPCEIMRPMAMGAAGAMDMAKSSARNEAEMKTLGVTIEAEYTVGEYDIVILSAKESSGLETWLQQSGYRVPLGASRALAPYIRQDMKFFVAKVNLTEHRRAGLTYLRPLQFAFESPKFMLPIRLGMINAQGPQDLIVYLLTENGRVETTNYRTVKLPSGMDIPEYVGGEFGDFYKAMFNQQVKRNDMRAVFTEYVWNMGWCDPCAAPPLSREELKGLGVFWLDEQPGGVGMRGGVMMYPPIGGGALPVMLTRLHVRYSADTFPEDLAFQETQDQENFQARYVLRHAWKGSREACPAAKSYFEEVNRRRGQEAETLADLTGWTIGDVIKKAGLKGIEAPKPWWQNIWD
ncbi:MAG: DUF2330 domain-containing protein [Candidatus Binatus sp.]|uniref:DUF2330 domain-containing protein n=1 Tax=Candidatus Binatus sp. TaxID=2811406 RepID=UPI002726E62A|nr:DUF2330 domain-containing protein [Candidatus Binatus sp.]MDO8433104.1 DUF2330 domain-containing protein [Candidatus Binatus sp.]